MILKWANVIGRHFSENISQMANKKVYERKMNWGTVKNYTETIGRCHLTQFSMAIIKEIKGRAGEMAH